MYFRCLCSAITVSIQFNTLFLSNPVSTIVPASWASGRSMELRSDMAGKLRMADSSLMVPLSLMVQAALHESRSVFFTLIIPAVHVLQITEPSLIIE